MSRACERKVTVLLQLPCPLAAVREDSPQGTGGNVHGRAAPVRWRLLARCGFDLRQRFGVLEGRDVPGIYAERLRSHCAADDFRATGLRQRRHEQNALRRESLSE